MQIVAPAGNLKAFWASIKGGADAVYLGMPHFGARAKAENFDYDGLKSAVENARVFGVKVFVTLNTLIKDKELDCALNAARDAYNLGVDAAIVQDLRFIKLLKTELPNLTLHASTQMGIHNADGAKQLLDLGIKRAVLARETLPADIVEIKKTGIEIEFFVQGALCVCFSGNCYFSSLASSYSGNRGKCMQLCRKPYYFKGERGYFLSAKDICLFDRLNELARLGVDAIKIEGRMRSEEYAYTACSVYSSDNNVTAAVKALKSVFNRGEYCSAYLDKDAPFRVIYPHSQANIGLSIGKISSVVGKTLSVKGFTAHKNDGFKVMRNKTEVCGATVQGNKIVADGKCQPGDELRRTFDGALSQQITQAPPRRIDIAVKVESKPNAKPIVTLSNDGVIERYIGKSIVERAINQAITQDDVVRTFNKGLSDVYPFNPIVTVEMDSDVFMPLSELNSLRRESYAILRESILRNYSVAKRDLPYRGLKFNKFVGRGTMLMVESERQLSSEILSKIDYLVLNPSDYRDFTVPQIDKPILLNMPVIMRGEDRNILINAVNRDGISGVVSNNLYTLGLTDKPILLGAGHNIIGQTDLPHVTSFEADCLDDGFAYVFGYAPVMTLCHCPYGKCINCSGRDELKDENGRVFKLRRVKEEHCYWQLLNCVPHFISVENVQNRFYDCTESSKKQIIDVLNGRFDGNFTRGNLNKGLK